MSPEAVRQTLHELGVHQIELELQNEELRRAGVEPDTSRARYFDLYDLAPVGYVTVSETGLILEANLAACTLLGLARGKVATRSLVGQPFFLFIQKEDSNVFHLVQKRIFETGEPQACDVRMVKPDGTPFWAYLKATVAQEAVGAPVCRITLSDITERKRAEEALQEKERRYRLLFDRANDGILLLSTDGKLVSVNEAFARMHGYRTVEMVTMSLGNLDTPETAQKVSERMARLLAGESLTFEVEHYHKDGHVFPLEVSASVISVGKATLIQCFHRDITERKRATASLSESERRYAQLAEQSGTVVWEVDAQGLYSRVSQVAQTVWGYRTDEIVGRLHFYDLHPEAGREAFKQAAFAIFARKESFKDLVNHISAKDGRMRWVSTNGMPQLDADGTLLGYSGSDTDITERKQLEWKLLERVKELRCLHDISALKLLPDISFIALMEGIVGLIPPAWQFPEVTAARITLEKQTFQTKNFRETPWIQACEIVVHGRPAGRLEVGYLEERPASDKGSFLTQERSLLNTIAERIGSICARQQAEEALALAAERLGLATRSGGVGIWDYDVVNNRLVWDDQMYRLYGILQSNFGGAYESWQEGLHPEDRSRAVEAIQLALRGEKEYDIEFRVVWPDATIRHIHAFALVQRDVSGQPLRMVGTNWDITAHHRLETLQKELEAKSQQIQKSESLGLLAGGVAHHFNNQLQTVLLNLELAGRNRPGNAELDKGLHVAVESTRKAAEVSTQMLTYLGQSQAKQEPLNLAETCRQSMVLLRAALPPSVVLETDLPSPGPGLRANAIEIKQVLMNLIINAWEAGVNERGVIRLSVKKISAAEILATDHFPLEWQPQATAYACLEVADTGSGIAAAEIPKIFDPFYSTKFTGRGLGLSVVLGVARSHNGVVTVKSEPGRGSVFRVYFPALAEAVPEKLAPFQPASVGNKSGRRTVLVVEDDPALRETFTAALEFCGFSVIAAEDGIEAGELFRQHQNEIGCVLCDVVMPRMNGWETLTALRQLAPDLPVILTSGYDEDKVMQGDHPELPQAFLRKPFQLKTCIDTVQLLTNRQE